MSLCAHGLDVALAVLHGEALQVISVMSFCIAQIVPQLSVSSAFSTLEAWHPVVPHQEPGITEELSTFTTVSQLLL